MAVRLTEEGRNPLRRVRLPKIQGQDLLCGGPPGPPAGHEREALPSWGEQAEAQAELSLGFVCLGFLLFRGS